MNPLHHILANKLQTSIFVIELAVVGSLVGGLLWNWKETGIILGVIAGSIVGLLITISVIAGLWAASVSMAKGIKG